MGSAHFYWILVSIDYSKALFLGSAASYMTHEQIIDNSESKVWASFIFCHQC